VLRIDECVVCGHIEYAAAPFEELSLDTKLFRDFGRQTGGSGEIASAHAVLDGNSHRKTLR
jgi:hypothetical protein